MAEKYLYFRTVTTLSDDDQAQDSVCYPLSKLVGMEMGTFGDADATADDDLFTIIFLSRFTTIRLGRTQTTTPSQ